MFNAKYDYKTNRYQTVNAHCMRVAELASDYANGFGCRDVGYLAGILHDLGKCSPIFEKVLKGEATKVNHSIAGAFIAKKAYRCDLAAKAIFAHHDPLRETEDIDIVLQNSFITNEYYCNGKRASVSGKDEYKKLSEIMQKELPFPPTKPRDLSYDFAKSSNIAKMLMTRMLLSCLCDADYLSSSEFDSDSVSPPPHPPDFEKYFDNLTAYRNNIIKRSSSNSELNLIRNRIYQSCIDNAENSPGLFTLTAPTGTGKTLSLLAFALKHAIKYGKKRIIIVLPFLSIIDQNAAVYREICGNILEDHSSYDRKADEYAAKNSERWSADVIVTTSVKFFEMLFKSKPSDLRRLHMISESVVVFDEAQTLPNNLLGATLDSVNALCTRFNTTILFSTATQPSFDYREDIEWKPREIIEDAAQIFDRTRRVEIDFNIKHPTPLDDIAERMSQKESCCAVLNRKSHVRKLYGKLITLCEPESCFMISTDLCSQHRKHLLDKIRYRLENDLLCRIVATQCIEAGVDIDVAVMYRALAPLDSIIQCAGRCNRNGLGEGYMLVFIPDEEKLYPSPYYEYGAQTVVLLLSRHDIDINNLSDIAEYYEILLTSDKNNARDDKRLTEAIKSYDYEETDKNYHLIDNSGFNIIVPYDEEIKLFGELKEQLLNEGISPILMNKARKITITSYDAQAIRNTCEQLYYYTHGARREKIQSNWYLLCDEKFYDDRMGFKADSSSELSYTF